MTISTSGSSVHPDGGWTCSMCNTWVPNGTIHFCAQPHPTAAPATYWYTTTTGGVVDQQARIASALERIATALEALREDRS